MFQKFKRRPRGRRGRIWEPSPLGANINANFVCLQDTYAKEQQDATPDYLDGNTTHENDKIRISSRTDPPFTDRDSRGILGFDVTAIPAGKTIDAIILHLKPDATPAAPVTLSLHDIDILDEGWNENWLNAYYYPDEGPNAATLTQPGNASDPNFNLTAALSASLASRLGIKQHRPFQGGMQWINAGAHQFRFMWTNPATTESYLIHPTSNTTTGLFYIPAGSTLPINWVLYQDFAGLGPGATNPNLMAIRGSPGGDVWAGDVLGNMFLAGGGYPLGAAAFAFNATLPFPAPVTHDSVVAIYPIANNNVWVVTQNGYVFQYTGAGPGWAYIMTVATPAGYTNIQCQDIFADTTGAVWVSGGALPSTSINAPVTNQDAKVWGAAPPFGPALPLYQALEPESTATRIVAPAIGTPMHICTSGSDLNATGGVRVGKVFLRAAAPPGVFAVNLTPVNLAAPRNHRASVHLPGMAGILVSGASWGFFDMIRFSATDIWVVGTAGYWHWDGTAWTQKARDYAGGCVVSGGTGATLWIFGGSVYTGALVASVAGAMGVLYPAVQYSVLLKETSVLPTGGVAYKDIETAPVSQLPILEVTYH